MSWSPKTDPLVIGNNSEDDWTSITAKEERKKRQNRLNQRARRVRKSKEKETSSDRKPFRVQRWRVSTAPKAAPESHSLFKEGGRSGDSSGTSGSSDSQDSVFLGQKDARYLEDNMRGMRTDDVLLIHPTFEPPPWWADEKARSPMLFPLSADHVLLHLVHFNVFRALTSNKAILSESSFLTKPTGQGVVSLLPGYRDFCGGVTLLHSRVDRPLPMSLIPTELQRSMAHSSWLNMFPWPRFRDNLIRMEGSFDAFDFCRDLWGEIYTNVGVDENLIVESDDGDDIALGRKGLIVWSEPWDADGWEMTPGFLRKWSCLLTNCEDMIVSSNRWRATRGEGPLAWDSGCE